VVSGLGTIFVGGIIAFLFKQVARAVGQKDFSRSKSGFFGKQPKQFEGTRRRGSGQRGKYWLVCLFFALRVIDPFFYFGARLEFQGRILGMILLSTMWTGVLMAGIWNGKDWTRTVLIGILVFTIVRDFIAISEVDTNGYSVSPLFLASVLIKLGTVLALVFSKDIKRLSQGKHLIQRRPPVRAC